MYRIRKPYICLYMSETAVRWQKMNDHIFMKRERRIIMDLFSILTLIGGLALFLYGMNAMGDGLAKVSGGSWRRFLKILLQIR